jgi:hypothetical protein
LWEQYETHKCTVWAECAVTYIPFLHCMGPCLSKAYFSSTNKVILLGRYNPKLNSPTNFGHRTSVPHFADISSVVTGIKHDGRRSQRPHNVHFMLKQHGTLSCKLHCSISEAPSLYQPTPIQHATTLHVNVLHRGVQQRPVLFCSNMGTMTRQDWVVPFYTCTGEALGSNLGWDTSYRD